MMGDEGTWDFLPDPDEAEGSLAEGIVYVSNNVEDGVKCPCCSQWSEVHRRTIYGSIGAWLVTLVRECRKNPKRWFSYKDRRLHQVKGGDYAKLVYWGLAKKKDGKGWRATKQGMDFVDGNISVPRYALVYDAEHVGMDGDDVFIQDILGTKYKKLLRTARIPRSVKKKRKRKKSNRGA